MGAWIEILGFSAGSLFLSVAPFMGAWIEIENRLLGVADITRRTLYGCVDWNSD